LQRVESYLSLLVEENHGVFPGRWFIPNVYSAAPPAVIFPAHCGAFFRQFPAAKNPWQLD